MLISDTLLSKTQTREITSSNIFFYHNESKQLNPVEQFTSLDSISKLIYSYFPTEYK